MKKIILLLCSGILSFCAGCRTQFVTVDVTPSDACVIANGMEYRNKSPMFIEASTGRQLALTVYKDGYKDVIYVIDYQLSTLGKIEAWTSFLIIPAIFLSFDNAWELKENNISIVLQPTDPVRQALEGKTIMKNQPTADQTTDPAAKRIFNEL